jgi:ADP-heptose:LPS heptosyltransferase
MLTWPALAYARKAFPNAQIDVLVAPSVEEIARACPYINDVVVDRGQPMPSLRKMLRQRHYDAAVALFSTSRVARTLWGADVAYRLGPATKVHQLFFNQRLKQHRSQSTKPEYRYNIDLVERLARDYGYATPQSAVEPPYWMLDQDALASAAAELWSSYAIPKSSKLIIVHPGSGGSARNLNIEQFAHLINQMHGASSLFVLVTAGPDEEDQARVLARLITAHPAVVHVSTEGLVAFAHVLALASLFISGSTGPLHIAGALDVATLAFYPRRRSATSLRWQTINQPKHALAFSPPADADELAMDLIDIDQAAQAASERFLYGNND